MRMFLLRERERERERRGGKRDKCKCERGEEVLNWRDLVSACAWVQRRDWIDESGATTVGVEGGNF